MELKGISFKRAKEKMGTKGTTESCRLPLRLLLLGLVAIWYATQAATRTVPMEKRFASVEMPGIYYDNCEEVRCL